MGPKRKPHTEASTTRIMITRTRSPARRGACCAVLCILMFSCSRMVGFMHARFKGFNATHALDIYVHFRPQTGKTAHLVYQPHAEKKLWPEQKKKKRPPKSHCRLQTIALHIYEVHDSKNKKLWLWWLVGYWLAPCEFISPLHISAAAYMGILITSADIYRAGQSPGKPIIINIRCAKSQRSFKNTPTKRMKKKPER